MRLKKEFITPVREQHLRHNKRDLEDKEQWTHSERTANAQWTHSLSFKMLQVLFTNYFLSVT